MLSFERLLEFFSGGVGQAGHTSRTRGGSWPVSDPDLKLAGAAGSGGSLETPTAVGAETKAGVDRVVRDG